jgi:hypothetical protein
MSAPPPPPTLDYASPRPALTVPPGRYTRRALFLIVATLVAAGVSGFKGLIYCDRLGSASVGFIAGAILTAYAVLGPMTRPRPAFSLAAAVTLVASTAFVSALFIIDANYRQTRARIVTRATTPVVLLSIETDRGAELATLELARPLSFPSAVLTPLLTLYLVTRRAIAARSKLANRA